MEVADLPLIKTKMKILMKNNFHYDKTENRYQNYTAVHEMFIEHKMFIEQCLLNKYKLRIYTC